MATKTVKITACDVCMPTMTEATESVTVRRNGKAKRYDLCTTHGGKLTVALGEGRTTRKAPAKRNGMPDAAVVRTWAKENGHEVPKMGRVPGAVIEAYMTAQTKPKAKPRKAKAKV